MRRSLLLWVAPVLFATTLVAKEQRVCITIDDLPCAGCAEGTWRQVTTDLLATLKKHRVPAIGFVNEGKLYHDGVFDSTRYALLEQWLQAGMDLGNHTFGHQGTTDHTVAEYEVDVVKGERALRPLMHRYGRTLRYFRHPFLQAGPTPGYRDSLNAVLARRGYVIAPVTFDNDEYIYAWCYEQAQRAADAALMARRAASYQLYMDSVMRFHEARTQAFLGRSIPQILLVHANALNAAELDTLLTRLEQRGYVFVPLEEALQDAVYTLPEATTRYGFSWIRRWELAAGQQPPWPPEIDPDAQRQYDARQR
ncbi:MAG TPA: polysaccharide deacetylase family protein [Flavobacteriales bacterium]|nr:polysaccharide deacetylase family protein [Flavobacteriales bacterium]